MAKLKLSKTLVVDIIERVVSTYVETLLALMAAGAVGVGQVVNIGFLERAAISAGPAILSAIKGVIASKKGDSDSASLAAPPVGG